MEDFVYHYTDLNALLGIIGSNSQKLTFWGSRYDCMNDPLDYKWAEKRILPQMLEVANEIAREQNYTPRNLKPVNVKPFIVSFSNKKDDFLMWRMYNAKVALVLDKSLINSQTPNSALIKCEYSGDKSEDIRKAFLKIDEQINTCFSISVNTAKIVTFIKEKSFETEGEYRLATWDYYDEAGNKIIPTDCIEAEPIAEKVTESRIDKNGKIIIYKKFLIDKNALRGIIIHTYSQLDFISIKNAIQTLLLEKNFSREICGNITPTSAYPFNL